MDNMMQYLENASAATWSTGGDFYELHSIMRCLRWLEDVEVTF